LHRALRRVPGENDSRGGGTAGALSVAAARGRPPAGSLLRRRRLDGLLQLQQPAIDALQLLAGALQHLGLHVELLARDQVEPAEHALQHAAEIRFQVALRLAQAARQRFVKAASQVVENAGIELHDGPRDESRAKAYRQGGTGAMQRNGAARECARLWPQISPRTPPT